MIYRRMLKTFNFYLKISFALLIFGCVHMSLNRSWNPSQENDEKIETFEERLKLSHRQIQQTRLENVRLVCRQQKSPVNSEDHTVTLITDESQTLGYCHVPKVASSAWMMAFSELNNFRPKEFIEELFLKTSDLPLPEHSTNLTDSTVQNIRSLKKKVEQNASNIDLLSLLAEYGFLHSTMIDNHSLKMQRPYDFSSEHWGSMFKFVFVRHPFDRLVSAFYDKFIKHRSKEFIQSVIDHDTSPIFMFKATVNEYFFKKKTKVRYRITFEKFVRFVLYEIKNKVISYGTYHWFPYSAYCAICEIPYDFIGKIETLQEDIRILIESHPEKFSLTENIFSEKRNSVQGKNITSNLHAFGLLPKSLILELYEVYKLDFLLGGYPYPQEYIDVGKDH